MLSLEGARQGPGDVFEADTNTFQMPGYGPLLPNYNQLHDQVSSYASKGNCLKLEKIHKVHTLIPQRY